MRVVSATMGDGTGLGAEREHRRRRGSKRARVEEVSTMVCPEKADADVPAFGMGASGADGFFNDEGKGSAGSSPLGLAKMILDAEAKKLIDGTSVSARRMRRWMRKMREVSMPESIAWLR